MLCYGVRDWYLGRVGYGRVGYGRDGYGMVWYLGRAW